MRNMEWYSELNPFNSLKILFHADRLRKIASENEYPPPIAVDIDPSNLCNQNCFYCNSKYYCKQSKFSLMPTGHLLNIGKFLVEWKVKAVCIAGGGEPLINQELKDLLPFLHQNNIQIGVLTNGTLIDDEYIELFQKHCRFVGISCDSMEKVSYEKIRGCDHIQIVKRNIARLARRKNKLQVTLKILINQFNYEDLFETARIAKELGCDAVQIRPLALDNVLNQDGNEHIFHFDFEPVINVILNQFKKCHELNGNFLSSV